MEQPIEDVIKQINEYPTDGVEWVKHRTIPELEIELTYPHRIRYLKTYTKEPYIMIRRICKSTNDYLTLGMNVGGKCFSTAQHILIAKHFLTKPSDAHYVITHINGCNYDNHIDNLKYVPLDNVSRRNRFRVSFKGKQATWINDLPDGSIEVNAIGDTQLLPQTFYLANNIYYQKYVNHDGNIKYRLMNPVHVVKEGRTPIDVYYFRNINGKQLQVNIANL
jgi:hypothetical protein